MKKKADNGNSKMLKNNKRYKNKDKEQTEGLHNENK